MSNTNTNLQTQTSNALHNAIMEADGKDRPPMFAPDNYTVLVAEGSSETTTEGYMENYKNVSQDIRDQLNAEAEAMWKAIERLKQGELINVQDLETNLYWEFGKFTSRDGESLESYYLSSYFNYNQNGFVTLVKQSQELKTVSYHKLYDILKQHQTEVNEIRAERLAPATRNRGKAIINSCTTTYDQEPTLVTDDDELLKDKEIDKLMALISLSFKKIYKPTNNNLRTSSNTSRENQDNTPRINRGTRYDNQRVVNVVGARENVGTPVVHHSGIQCYICKEYRHVARECQKPKRAKDAAYHKEKMLLCKQEEIQEVTPDAADNSGPIFDVEPLQKVQINDDNYNVFAIKNKHPEQPESVNDTYLEEQGDTSITINSLYMCNNGETVNHDDDDLAKERNLLASLIEKLKYEIDDRKNHHKFLETSNKALVDKLKGEIEDFKTKNKSLESSNNHFKEANNELSC
ncbi:gag-pol polyprotein [Tanacetum coccineum]